jgi:hypothetical protein
MDDKKLYISVTDVDPGEGKHTFGECTNEPAQVEPLGGVECFEKIFKEKTRAGGDVMGKPNAVPIIPPLTEEQKRQRDYIEPNPTIAKCGECHMELKQVMGYVCMNRYCPLKTVVIS